MVKENLTQREIKELWEKYIRVPESIECKIEENFYIWEKGTNKKEIWSWFEAQYEGGIDRLITCF